MVRCDDFYRKWLKVGNFCEKNPRTVEQIEVYLDKIVPLLEELSAESEILNSGNTAIALELSETASRPLISEKDPEVRKEAMQQIVTLAEEKVMDSKKPQVTSREVVEILAEVKGTLAQEPDDKPLACSLGGAQEKEEHPEPESVKPTPDQVEMVQDWEEKRPEGTQTRTSGKRRPGISKILTDVVDFKVIRNKVMDLPCPWCKKRSILVWQCCGHTVDESIVVATQKADAHMDKLDAALKSHARTYEQYRADVKKKELEEAAVLKAKQEEQQL